MHKSDPRILDTYAYVICDLSARDYFRLQDRSRLGAQTKNAFYLNKILREKPRILREKPRGFSLSSRSRSV